MTDPAAKSHDRSAENEARAGAPRPRPLTRAMQVGAAIALALVAATAAAWVSARDDGAARFAAAERGGDPTTTRGERAVESPPVSEAAARLFGPDARAAFAASPVPVLAPSDLTAEQAASFAESFRATPDGYFAQAPYDGYDLVVNATRLYATPPTSAGARERDTTEIRLSETEIGLAATFARYGADYSVELACRGAGGDGPTCLTKDEARARLASLVVVGGGG